ncbi:uncharacterized protein [Mytilus edulis]|uniref:uncharacterized protein isoform X2 n=1 Tax=Mytilus edulis TaxID=6550 RepID=UPI0039F087FA
MWWNFIINLGISTMIIVTKSEQESYACNFEQDFCNWLPEINTSAFNWTRIRTFKDHTTGSGYYIAIDGAMSTINKIHAELSTDFESSNRSKCISFWYNMNSVQGSTLELYQINETGMPIQLREYIKSTEDIWIRETVDLPGTGPYRIIFRGTVVAKFTEYIGLDDINTFEGNCSELPSINDYSTVPYNTAETFELPSINDYSTVPYNTEETFELPSINDYSTVPYNTEETFDMTGLAVAIVTCGGLVVCLIIAGICVFKRKTEKQRTLNTDKISNKTDSMNISKTNEVRSTQQTVGLAVHEYVDIDLSKDSSCSDRTKNKENIFRYELAKPLTSDPGGAFRYDLAKPLDTVVKDDRSNDINVSNKSNDCSEYDTTKMNESTKYNGYNETENIVVYSRTFDGVYDVASNGKRNVTSDNAYEHCAIQDKQ